jgi:hypothetical protein
VEGAPQAEWMSAAEQARELFRWLTQDAAHRADNDTNIGGTAAHRQSRVFAKNLEATIKLQKIELAALAERPWPINSPEYFRKPDSQPPAPDTAQEAPAAG